MTDLALFQRMAEAVVEASPYGITEPQAFSYLVLASVDGWDLKRVCRLLVKVEPADSGCLMWRGATTPTGYGKFSMGAVSAAGNRLPDGAHRASYRIFIGPIPSDLELDHLCRNRACVNPLHLQAVDHRTNLMRGNTVSAWFAAQTACRKGHPKTEENTYFWRGKAHGCRTCQGLRYQAKAIKNRAAQEPKP